MFRAPRFITHAALSSALLLAPVIAQADGHDVVRLGDLEMHCVAQSTAALTPEAAHNFNVTRAPDRGLLTIALFRHTGQGQTETQAGQVFAGAINQGNTLTNIPVREVRQGPAVYYLGEFRLQPPDSLRFLINAHVGDKTLKANFKHDFNPIAAP